MLFNSYDFILIFLPITLLAYVAARFFTRSFWIELTLLIASLLFYSGWDVHFLPVLLSSIAVNYAFACALWHTGKSTIRRAILAIGIATNLSLLFWFKYVTFALMVVSNLLHLSLNVGAIVLPIGISFFTFQQIAFLVDISREEVVTRNFIRYALYVSFFPQLIAGPIVHHREFSSQVSQLWRTVFRDNFVVGLSIFVIGLSKKVLLADSFALVASPVFDVAGHGTPVGLLAAWAGTVAYALQIYFDFSAYSDMAIGLSRMFGIVLPLNFASPYKARSIIDFWRRWHITLSRFLRHYLYIPMGGSHCRRVRREFNVFVTMLLGGIWHGAGWTFVVWGTIHGVLIVANHFWRLMPGYRPLPATLAWPLTFLAVVLAWVPFRAPDLATAVRIYTALLGLHGLAGANGDVNLFGIMPQITDGLAFFLPALPWPQALTFMVLLAGLLIVFFAPNTQSLMRGFSPGLATPGYATGLEEVNVDRSRASWRPIFTPAVLTGLGLAVCLMMLNHVTEFIYFQF